MGLKGFDWRKMGSIQPSLGLGVDTVEEPPCLDFALPSLLPGPPPFSRRCPARLPLLPALPLPFFADPLAGLWGGIASSSLCTMPAESARGGGVAADAGPLLLLLAVLADWGLDAGLDPGRIWRGKSAKLVLERQ
jgi:hypothetical protein